MNRLIFVVEGDEALRGEISDFIEGQNYEVTTFSKAWRVIPAAEKTRPALFLINTVLAGEGGFNLCWRIRHHPAFHDTPVVLLSPTANEDDLVHGFAMGADDYLSKPISLHEMAVRIRTVIRRFERTCSASSVQAGRFELDRGTMALSVEGRDVPIGRAEFRLLDFLVRNPRQVFSREQILASVWGGEKGITPSAVTVQMRQLRMKIEADPARPRFLQTVRGLGYRFDPEEIKRKRIARRRGWTYVPQTLLPGAMRRGGEQFLESNRGGV